MKNNWKYIAWTSIALFVLACFLFVAIKAKSPSDENNNQSTGVSDTIGTGNTIPDDNTIPSGDVVEDEDEDEREDGGVHEEETVILDAVSKQYIVIESDSIKELEVELAYCQEKLTLSQSIIDSAIGLGYEDTCDFLQVIYQDCENYQSYVSYYEERIRMLSELRYETQLEEYPAATFIWYYMKAQGWSDYVCAGIMGNIMQETGGRTLNILFEHEDAYYYGMCCWRKEFHPEVVGLDLAGQCEYLVGNTEYIMDTYGYLYMDGYDFEQFLAATSIEEVAAAFLIVYERPGHTNPTRRTENGELAYEYFVG